MDILIEELDQSLWVAGLERGLLTALELDMPLAAPRWGDIYHAKILSADKKLDAVFLDLDGKNKGLLYNKDTRHKAKNGTVVKGGEKPIGQTLTPGQYITVQIKTAPAPIIDDNSVVERKMPQVSMDIGLQGRYLIFSPTLNDTKISARIRDKALRDNLTTMHQDTPELQHCIIRSAASDVQHDILVREGENLAARWATLMMKARDDKPRLLFKGPNAIERLLSDYADRTIERLEVAIMDHYRVAEAWCMMFAPDLVPKITPIEIEGAEKDLALFHYRDIIGQIEDLLHPYAILPSGGNLIIQETAALTAIDVNKSASGASHLAVNLEALKEAARQIRIRNLGGAIMIDFLRLKTKADKKALERAIIEIINQDPCTVQFHGETNTGFYEFTRKRRTPALTYLFDEALEG